MGISTTSATVASASATPIAGLAASAESSPGEASTSVSSSTPAQKTGPSGCHHNCSIIFTKIREMCAAVCVKPPSTGSSLCARVTPYGSSIPIGAT